MATNCPQQVKPRAWRSAWCLRTAVSNSQRENSPRICEKMLQNRFTAEPPKSLIGSARTQSQLSRGSAFFAPDFAIHNLDKPASPKINIGEQVSEDVCRRPTSDPRCGARLCAVDLLCYQDRHMHWSQLEHAGRRPRW